MGRRNCTPITPGNLGKYFYLSIFNTQSQQLYLTRIKIHLIDFFQFLEMKVLKKKDQPYQNEGQDVQSKKPQSLQI